MKAYVVSALSDDFSGAGLADVATPAPGKGQVLIKLRAASVNFPDVLMCQGKYQLKPPLPFSPGMDIAGEIAALGEGVTGWSVGDSVIGAVRTGGFAEYAVAPVDMIWRKPARLDDAQAACYGAVYLTAYVAFVRRALMVPGETLLVHGAAGGTGLAAVDLGKMLGAKVIATASSETKRAFLKDYGADHVLPSSGFREAVKDLTGGRGADVIFDPVGGDVFDESARCIAFDGRLLVIGFTSGRIPSISVNMPLIKGYSVVGVRAGEYGRQFPEKGRENREAVAALAADGKIRPHVCAQFPLAETRAAMAMLQDRTAIGKVVVRPDL